MASYQKQFAIRWGDLDPNRHVANTTYMGLLNEARMGIMMDLGFDQAYLQKEQVGPVIFQEDYHYVREVLPNSRVTIKVKLSGASEDWRIMELSQGIFLESGNLAVRSDVLFAWMDLNTRKLRVPPPDLLAAYQAYPRTEGFRVIQRADTRSAKVDPAATLDSF